MITAAYHIKKLRTLLNKINEEGEKDEILCKDLEFFSNVYMARHFLHDFEIAMETINDLVETAFFERENPEFFEGEKNEKNY